MKSKKPEIGLVPKFIWESSVKSERLVAVLGAIARYAVAGQPVPQEWKDEEEELLEYFREEEEANAKPN